MRKRLPFSKKQVKAISKIANKSGERHRESNSASSTNIFDNTPLKLQVIQNLSQGDGQGNRQGDEIQPQSLMVRGYVKATGSQQGNVRLIAIQYKNDTQLTDAQVPSPEEFFPDPDETSSRYKVLFDRVYSLNPDGKECHFLKFKIAGRKMSKVKFDEGATTIRSGELYVYIQGDTDMSTGNNIEGKLTSKLLYADN